MLQAPMSPAVPRVRPARHVLREGSTHGVARMAGRLSWSGAVTVGVWLLAGAVAAHGVMHVVGRSADVPLPAPAVAQWVVDTPRVAHALGAQDKPAAAPVVSAQVPLTRYTLLGVVASAAGGASGSGVALIAIDGQRPTPYRVGAVLDGRWQVAQVQRKAVVLSAVGGAGVGVNVGGGAKAAQTQTLTVAGVDPAVPH